MTRVIINSRGEKISEYRVRRGWSQAELARRANISAGVVSRLEAGTKVLPATSHAVTTALDVKFEDCFEYTRNT